MIFESMILEFMAFPTHLDQHRTALPAADAFGGDAAPGAQSLHRIDEMQHDAIAAAANRMTETDGAAIDIEFGAVDLAGRAFKAQNLAAEFVIVPRRQAPQHLRGEGLVQFPGLDIAER